MEATTPAAATEADIIALKWFVRHACNSNVQLAVISNVCRRWRQVALDAVTTEASALAASAGGHIIAVESKGRSSLRRLLLTDMARELLIRQNNERENDAKETYSHPMQQKYNGDGSFCLAWFAPTGIQPITVSLDNDVSKLLLL